MSLEKLNNNIAELERVLKELKNLEKNSKYSSSKQKENQNSAKIALFNRLTLVNNAIPLILNEISATKKLGDSSMIKKENHVESYSYLDPTKQKSLVSLNKKDKESYLKELSISQENLKKISKENQIDISEKPSSLAKVSNKFFANLTDRIAKDKFSGLKKDLRESNSRFLLPTYLAIALFVSLSIFLGSLILFLTLGFIFGNIFSYLWVPLFLVFLSGCFYYFYPSLEKGTINQRITNELPFATIYMSAIAGSNIEPTKIFKIVSSNPEYRNVAVEIKKVINQVEVYGYDLVNALRNVAKSTPNEKLSELLEGMATNIVSGGSLKNYLEKKSENLLLDYKLERERYNALAATFMDIYISVLITAPLILVIMIIIMSITGFNLGLTPGIMIGVAIFIVAIINILFLIFLQIKQPKS